MGMGRACSPAEARYVKRAVGRSEVGDDGRGHGETMTKVRGE